MKQVTNKVIYRPISELCEWADNPRAITEEGIEHLMKSIERDPLYIEARPLLLSDRTGKLVVIGGNQRMKACTRLGWREVPTVLFSGLTEEEEYEKATIDNTHDGVWDSDKLREACEKWGASKLESWGITDLPTFDEIEDDDAESEQDKENKYTKKVEAPVYEIKGDNVHVSDVFDNSKTESLIQEIEASNVPDELKYFLTIAAYRHTVINFEKVAELYATLDKDSQELFEHSALVIVDYNDAIKNGFLQMSKRLQELNINYDEK